jgi:general secretion pathway protein F/type IV pilus assembly protein PilC
MANYRYIAKTHAGEPVDGLMQADSESAVLRTLGDRGLYPVQVAIDSGEGVSMAGPRIKPREVGVLFQQMGELLHAGVPMLRTLDTLVRAASSGPVKQIVQDLRDSVSKGESLADALGEHPQAFSPLHKAMVRAGEEAGFLESVLENLAAYIERQDELRSKVRGMMIYPLVLCAIGGLIMLLILIFLVPKFRNFFVNIELPAPTLVIFSASDLLTHHFPLLLAIGVLLGMGLWVFFRSETGQSVREWMRLNLPLVGRINRSVAVGRFCRILGTMLHNGVPILRALDISKDATGSRLLSERVEEAAENVKAGEPLAEPFRQSGLFGDDVIEMIAVAEESNQMDTVLVRIADTVERRTDRQVDTLMRLVEPLILVLMAGTIGFVAVGLLYPIFLMSETLT